MSDPAELSESTDAEGDSDGVDVEGEDEHDDVAYRLTAFGQGDPCSSWTYRH